VIWKLFKNWILESVLNC